MSDAPAKAAALAESFEGFRAAPYLDVGGVPTQGFGSTRDENGNPITMQHPPISESTAIDWLTRDMHAAFEEIQNDITTPITSNETAAVADFIYNVGAGNFRSSTLLRLLNAGQYQAAAAQFDRWDMAAGRVLAGLLRRRQAETALFNTPDANA